jgi:hypothetical protein
MNGRAASVRDVCTAHVGFLSSGKARDRKVARQDVPAAAVKTFQEAYP